MMKNLLLARLTKKLSPRIMFKKKTVISLLCFILLVLLFAPSIYRWHATNKLADKLDEKYGENGWVATSVISNNQDREQINLYRTLYIKFFYPRLLEFTPYEKLKFTHKCGWSTKAPHYAVLVYCPDGEFAYRWSMKNDSWYVSYHNPMNWEREQNELTLREIHARTGSWIPWKNIKRINGLNEPQK